MSKFHHKILISSCELHYEKSDLKIIGKLILHLDIWARNRKNSYLLVIVP